MFQGRNRKQPVGSIICNVMWKPLPTQTRPLHKAAKAREKENTGVSHSFKVVLEEPQERQEEEVPRGGFPKRSGAVG